MQANNASQKIDAVVASLLDNVEKRCQCGFSLTNVIAPIFQCFNDSENAVTYRVEISGTPLAPVDQIVSHIEEWLVEGALIHFDMVPIPIDDSCPVVVTSFDDPECPRNEQPLSLMAAIGGGAGGIVFLLVIAVILIIIIIYSTRSRCAKRSGKPAIETK